MSTNRYDVSLKAGFIAVVSSLLLVPASPDVTAAAPIVSKESAFPVKALMQTVDASDVRVIKAVEHLPPAVRARFREKVASMGNGDGKPTKTSIIDMANPGKSWNAGCMQMSGLPSRQLQFAGVAGNKCFVVFNTGGIASRQWVAIFDLSQKTTSLLGIASATPRCTDLAGLRKTVRSEAFRKAPNSTTISL
ncbi:MAG: hypothetical protein V4671_31725 [Armatimonadota bacterium]